jgi:hypothetical protein
MAFRIRSGEEELMKTAGKELGNTLGLKAVPRRRAYYAKPDLISI